MRPYECDDFRPIGRKTNKKFNVYLSINKLNNNKL